MHLRDLAYDDGKSFKKTLTHSACTALYIHSGLAVVIHTETFSGDTYRHVVLPSPASEANCMTMSWRSAASPALTNLVISLRSMVRPLQTVMTHLAVIQRVTYYHVGVIVHLMLHLCCGSFVFISGLIVFCSNLIRSIWLTRLA